MMFVSQFDMSYSIVFELGIFNIKQNLIYSIVTDSDIFALLKVSLSRFMCQLYKRYNFRKAFALLLEKTSITVSMSRFVKCGLRLKINKMKTANI